LRGVCQLSRGIVGMILGEGIKGIGARIGREDAISRKGEDAEIIIYNTIVFK
jgi:hypothetical protein